MPTTTAAAAVVGIPLGNRPQAIHIPNPFSIGAGKVIGWIVSGITKAINAFFGGLVKDALNPLLKLLGQTLLTTPDPSTLPRVGVLWENSREIAVAAYALLILIAGILVMAYETVQTRHSIKEIAPRIVVGFITANMSLLLAGKAVSFANALSTGLTSGGVDPKSAASTLTSLVMNAVTNGGIFLIFIGLGLAVILLALLVTYVIRVALTVILIAGAPLALMCHALPQTEGIARWWWRAFAGVLAIQLAQSLTLIAALNVFLAKGGFTFFGPTGSGLVDLIVTIALLYILWKIPFWILHSIQVGGGRSFLGGVIKGVIAYKTLGLIGLRGSAGARTASTARHRPPGMGGPGGLGPGGPSRPVRPGGPNRPAGGPAGVAGRRTGTTPPRRPAGGHSGTSQAAISTLGAAQEDRGQPPRGRGPRLATVPAPPRPTRSWSAATSAPRPPQVGFPGTGALAPRPSAAAAPPTTPRRRDRSPAQAGGTPTPTVPDPAIHPARVPIDLPAPAPAPAPARRRRRPPAAATAPTPPARPTAARPAASGVAMTRPATAVSVTRHPSAPPPVAATGWRAHPTAPPVTSLVSSRSPRTPTTPGQVNTR